jgi:REP element-mobilizing transposase RayT
MLPSPLYLESNCVPAYQLNWALSVFGKERLPSPSESIELLRIEVAKDQIQILEARFREPNVALFFLSSQPQSSPSQIVRSIKGRWQYLSREFDPIEFRRNYRIESCGDAKEEVLDAYVANQPQRHRMADDRVQSIIESLQFHDRNVDLAAVHRSSYGEFVYALQIVLELEPGWNEVRMDVLKAYRAAVLATCHKHKWRLARIGLLSNHLHILVGPDVTDSPQSVALSLMNNLVYTQRMKPVLRWSYYVGGFGKYDRGAIWNAQRKEWF